ncbi:unnamed protein product [Moneuplotes crassus]|uniref:Uncharacterized protein n=1 Tax=Euplotes crassus TaxID=5936 RepID=A0AAD1XB87_EUPCR|nr:unnamed protein product [Moneuplotes crassus]
MDHMRVLEFIPSANSQRCNLLGMGRKIKRRRKNLRKLKQTLKARKKWNHCQNGIC